MVINFKEFDEQVKELIRSKHSLRLSIERLENGTPPTKRTWFYENKTPEWILQQVQGALKRMQDHEFIADWDLSKSDKYAPQGESSPLKDRMDSLEEYFLHLNAPEIIRDPLWNKAKSLAVKRLKLNETGTPLTVDAVIKRGLGEQKYNTSSGYPEFLKRKNPIAIAHAKSYAMDSIRLKYPCVLGSRASMGKTGKKARLIFMASMDVNVKGQRYAIPFQDYVRSLKLDFFTPWEGWDYVQAQISRFWTENNLKFGTDYTKMDQHFNIHHGLECLDVIKHYFHRQYWPELTEIITYVFNMPIITNFGIIDQEHAMPSGSEWTNLLETVWDYIFNIYLELKYHFRFSCCMGIGDDQLLIFDPSYNIAEKKIPSLVKIVTDEFDRAGLPGNPEKQEVGFLYTTFLQRYLIGTWNGLHGETPVAGVYSLIRNVTSQVFPEFWHNEDEWDKNMFVLRVLMIAENANQHPLFKWYVQEFIAKSNDNILEFIRKGSKHWDETSARAKKISNFMPTYNQEKANKPLKDFDCVRLLLEIA